MEHITIRKHSLVSAPVGAADSQSIKIHLWAQWHYIFDLCPLSDSVAWNKPKMTQRGLNSPHHQISAFTGVLEMKFNFRKVGQQHKLDHTVCAFRLISRGLRAPRWRSKSSPATHHISTSRHREAPPTAVLWAHSVPLFQFTRWYFTSLIESTRQ